MTSILTNVSAQIALQTLRQINYDLDMVNNRVSTGLEIAVAADSSAYWAIAAVTGSDNSSLQAATDALGVGRNVIDVAYQGLESAREGLDQIRALLVTARSPGIDRANIQTEITGILADIRANADASTINTQNILVDDTGAADFNPNLEVVSAFQRTAAGSTISTINVSVSGAAIGDGTLLYDAAGAAGLGILSSDRTVGGTTANFVVGDPNQIDISALTDSPADLQVIEEYIQIVDAAFLDITTNQNRVGVALSRIDARIEFNTRLYDANDRAIGTLVDADIEVESTRLRALQAQQQLAIQSLGIANQASQNLLSLFQ